MNYFLFGSGMIKFWLVVHILFITLGVVHQGQRYIQ